MNKPVTLDELCENPEKHGFKFVPCDRCGGAYYTPDFTPTVCFGCAPSIPPEGDTK